MKMYSRKIVCGGVLASVLVLFGYWIRTSDTRKDASLVPQRIGSEIHDRVSSPAATTLSPSLVPEVVLSIEEGKDLDEMLMTAQEWGDKVKEEWDEYKLCVTKKDVAAKKCESEGVVFCSEEGAYAYCDVHLDMIDSYEKSYLDLMAVYHAYVDYYHNHRDGERLRRELDQINQGRLTEAQNELLEDIRTEIQNFKK